MTQRFDFDDMADEAMIRVQAHIALEADKLRAWCGHQIACVADRHDLRTWVIQQQRRTRQAVRQMADLPIRPAILQQLVANVSGDAAGSPVRITQPRETNLIFVRQRPVFDDVEPDRRFWPVLGVIGMTLALGWLGPTLDAQPDRRAEWLQAEQELHAQGTLAQWEAEAREACAHVTGENGAYIAVRGGGIVCTDKHGRKVGRHAQ